MKNIKVRYSPKEKEKIEERAKILNKSTTDYTKEVTKKAKVKIEVENEP